MARIRHGIIGLGWFGEYHGDALAGLPERRNHTHCAHVPKRGSRNWARSSVPRSCTRTTIRCWLIRRWTRSASPRCGTSTRNADSGSAEGRQACLPGEADGFHVADCRAIVAARASDRYFMVGHIVRFNPRYAAVEARDRRRQDRPDRVHLCAAQCARVDRRPGATQDRPHHRRRRARYRHHAVVQRVAQIETAYAQTLNVHGHKHPDLGWTMYRFDTGAIGILENVWCMPDNKGYFPDERMEVIGTEGGIYLQETYPALSVVTKEGAYTPDPTYWPEIRPGVRGGALAEELNYFLTCIADRTPPTVITPEEVNGGRPGLPGCRSLGGQRQGGCGARFRTNRPHCPTPRQERATATNPVLPHTFYGRTGLAASRSPPEDRPAGRAADTLRSHGQSDQFTPLGPHLVQIHQRREQENTLPKDPATGCCPRRSCRPAPDRAPECRGTSTPRRLNGCSISHGRQSGWKCWPVGHEAVRAPLLRRPAALNQQRITLTHRRAVRLRLGAPDQFPRTFARQVAHHRRPHEVRQREVRQCRRALDQMPGGLQIGTGEAADRVLEGLEAHFGDAEVLLHAILRLRPGQATQQVVSSTYR